jgi:hypothetical protein
MERGDLEAEQGRLTWPELARHFARGVVVVVAPELDLLVVADAMARDDRTQFVEWMTSGQVIQALDSHAQHWESTGVVLNAIVVAPWVLVSEASLLNLSTH